MSTHKKVTLESLGLSADELETFARGSRFLHANEKEAEQKKGSGNPRKREERKEKSVEQE